MTWSPLMSRSVASSKYSSRQGNAVTRLIPHHTGGGSNEGNIRYLATAEKKVSSTYVLTTTGELVGIVPEEFRPWTTGWEGDKGGITVETVNSSGAPDWRVTDAQVYKLMELAADLAHRYGWGSIDRARRLKGHREYANTSCPGPYLWGKFDDIMNGANKLLSPSPVAPIKNIPNYAGAKDMMIPVHPNRNADTRKTQPLVAGKDTQFGLNPALVPSSAVAVAINITAIGGDPWSHLTVWGSGNKPLASVLNFNPGQTITNASYVGPIKDLKFFMNASSAMDVIFDVTGYWTP